MAMNNMFGDACILDGEVRTESSMHSVSILDMTTLFRPDIHDPAGYQGAGPDIFH